MKVGPLTPRELNIIRGKVLAGHAHPAEILRVFAHLDHLEDKLNESDESDTFGTEGWRHYFDMPE